MIARRAGVVFAGQVTAIRIPQTGGGTEGVVEIDFAVEDAIRGVAAGQYTLREWAGLWSAGMEPLHLGQRYLMLLHPGGSSGLSSPVGGVEGAVPIQGSAAPSGKAMGARTVDLRWIAANALRSVSYSADANASETSRSASLTAYAGKSAATVFSGSSPAATPAEAVAAYADVKAVLGAAENSRNAMR